MSAFAPSELGAMPNFAEPAVAVWKAIWRNARQVYPSSHPMSWVRRARFCANAWMCRREWRALRHVPPQSELGKMMQARRDMAHILAWPYLHRAWSIRHRVETVVAHYRHVERHAWLQIPLGTRQLLAHVGPAEEGLTLQLDQPEWMSQEGELTLSLFEGTMRLYSVAFSIGRRKGRPTLYIGAIQGRSTKGITERYAELTKRLHGCRPRDLVLLATLFLAEAMDIERVYAISDYYRHYRHARMLARLDKNVPTADYDEIWRDRGGVETVDGFFAIETAYQPRPLETVATKKRAMYRRRYEMLGAVRESLHGAARANQPPAQLQHEPAL
ncbi:DUF535 family protein [Ideonella sp. DXS29W]|uniref:DUF535 family protein n=1 Tax=Ideonella lacteola TaxID=2984193 RepID=A0ABU9BK88_9BURK